MPQRCRECSKYLWISCPQRVSPRPQFLAASDLAPLVAALSFNGLLRTALGPP